MIRLATVASKKTCTVTLAEAGAGCEYSRRQIFQMTKVPQADFLPFAGFHFGLGLFHRLPRIASGDRLKPRRMMRPGPSLADRSAGHGLNGPWLAKSAEVDVKEIPNSMISADMS